MFELEAFGKQMYRIEESTCDTVGTFWRPSQSFRTPRSDSPPVELYPPFTPRYVTAYDQNHKGPSTSSTSLSCIYRGDADLSANVELAYCLQRTRSTECTPI